MFYHYNKKGDKKMKFLFVIFALLLSVSFGLNAAPKLTVYDDGRSCPARCDSHVVMHPSLNSTQYAHKSNSGAEILSPCLIGSDCEICFDDEAKECLITKYRGSGPGENTFDLTPAFYKEWCDTENLPKALEKKCKQLNQNEKKLDGRVNCINFPQNALCAELMEKTIQAKVNDQPLYDECIRVGQSSYNRNRLKSEKRTHDCGYEYESNGGPNSRGLKWKKLLPGACREGTFVGRDGLDCCSGEKFVDASLGLECKLFYPLKN